MNAQCYADTRANSSQVTFQFNTSVMSTGGPAISRVIPDWVKRLFGRRDVPIAVAERNGNVTFFPPTVAASTDFDFEMLAAEADLDVNDSYSFTNDHFYDVAQRTRRSWKAPFDHIEFDPD